MRLTPDGYGGFVWTDLHPGDIVPDGVGGYYIYSEEKKKLLPYNREMMQISDKTQPVPNIYLQQTQNTQQIDHKSYITCVDNFLKDNGVDESKTIEINIPIKLKDSIENIIIKWS